MSGVPNATGNATVPLQIHGAAYGCRPEQPSEKDIAEQEKAQRRVTTMAALEQIQPKES